MQKIKKLYRSTFTGGDSPREMIYSDGEWVKSAPAPFKSSESRPTVGAVVLGNGVSRVELDSNLLVLLKEHSGFVTYGCNAIIRDFSPDYVCVNDELMQEYLYNGLYAHSIAYGTSKMVLEHPDKFYPVPQNPNWNMGAIAAYLACFDGHKTVYLLGHDLFSGEHNYQMNVYSGTPGYPDTYDLTTEGYFERSLLQVMQTYDDVDFVRVVPSNTHYMPESWKYLLNLRQLTFREFVIETDLG